MRALIARINRKLTRSGRIERTRGDCAYLDLGQFYVVDYKRNFVVKDHYADSGGSRPRIRDDLAHHSDLISLGVPR
jgi:hypothetical protein